MEEIALSPTVGLSELRNIQNIYLCGFVPTVFSRVSYV